MFRVRWAKSRRALVPIVSASILASLFASNVVLAADKTFSATITSPLTAGASYGEGARASSTLTLTITNESTQASLGAANVTPPAGIDVTAVGNPPSGTATLAAGDVIQLRTLNLAPGQSASVAVSARVECGANHASYLWTFDVRQSNDFNGVGNNLTQVGSTTNTVSGSCQIAFSKQPRSSEKAPVAITNKIYDPSGDPVTVTVSDGANVDTVAWWSGTISLAKGNDETIGDVAVLGGTTSGSASGGSVIFAPTLSIAASRYTLTASATPTANSSSVGTSSGSVESSQFNIVDDATICGATSACSASAGHGQKTQADVDASATGGSAGDLVILSVADPTVTLQCGSYNATSDIVSFDVTTSDGTTSSNRAKQATLTLQAQYVTQSASKYDVCYSSPIAFTDKSGATVTTGLLPTCAQKNPVLPCVVSKALNKQKDLVIVISAPPGDPKIYT
jgi:hypothetical protein